MKKLEAEAKKASQADESRVRRWFSFLAEISTDVWEVAVRAFSNPISRLNLVFQKVAQRAKEGREQGKT